MTTRAAICLCFVLLVLSTEAKPPTDKGKPDNNGSTGGGGGSTGGPKKPFKARALARYIATLHPCPSSKGSIQFSRGSTVLNVLTTETPGTNAVKYGLMTKGTAAAPTSQAVYSTHPCDPLVNQTVVLELTGEWTQSGTKAPLVYVLGGLVNSTALPQPIPASASKKVKKAKAWGKMWKLQPLYVSFFVNSTVGNGTVYGKLMRNR